jgi:hypothetical protein
MVRRPEERDGLKGPGWPQPPTFAKTIDYVLDRGVSVRLISDDQQLAAIGAGGVLRDICEVYGAVTLSQVMRFSDPVTGAPNHAEGAASLALRDGDSAAVAYYTDNNRIHGQHRQRCRPPLE